MTFLSRSCVIGRGVATFSICSAIAFASKTPTQMGSTRCPSLSRRMMMGMLVIGSTISPLIVISICMDRLAPEAVRVRAGNPDVHDAPDARRIARKIHDRVAAGPAGKLPVAPPARGVHQHRFDPAHGVREQLHLNQFLLRLERDNPPRLLVL